MCRLPNRSVVDLFSSYPKKILISNTNRIESIIRTIGLKGLCRLACATKDDTIEIYENPSNQGSSISLKVTSQNIYDPGHAPNPERIIRTSANGLFIENKKLCILPTRQGAGIARLAIALQIEAALIAGITKIIVTAAGDAYYCERPGDLSGFKYWPSLGFDGDIPSLFNDRVAASGDSAARAYVGAPRPKTIQNLIALPYGRNLWQTHGLTTIMEIGLTTSNPAIRWVAPYLRSVGL